jgi:putative oligomerization/nucleic acid binding protein
MPLLRRRPLLRAAAVGGGAYMAGKHVANARAQEQDQAYHEGQQSAMAPAPPPQSAPPPAGGMTSDAISQLKQLGELHEQGILTDDEFAREKARILGA